MHNCSTALCMKYSQVNIWNFWELSSVLNWDYVSTWSFISVKMTSVQTETRSQVLSSMTRLFSVLPFRAPRDFSSHYITIQFKIVLYSSRHWRLSWCKHRIFAVHSWAWFLLSLPRIELLKAANIETSVEDMLQSEKWGLEIEKQNFYTTWEEYNVRIVRNCCN